MIENNIGVHLRFSTIINNFIIKYVRSFQISNYPLGPPCIQHFKLLALSWWRQPRSCFQWCCSNGYVSDRTGISVYQTFYWLTLTTSNTYHHQNCARSSAPGNWPRCLWGYKRPSNGCKSRCNKNSVFYLLSIFMWYS